MRPCCVVESDHGTLFMAPCLALLHATTTTAFLKHALRVSGEILAEPELRDLFDFPHPGRILPVASSNSARASAGVCDQVLNASSAARMARSASSAFPLENTPTTCSL